MTPRILKLRKLVSLTVTTSALLAAGAGIGVLADHFNVNNVPSGWTYTKTEGQKVCYRGCSSEVVSCDSKGQVGSQIKGGSITYHPKGEGGMNNPHVFTVALPDGPKLNVNGKECRN